MQEFHGPVRYIVKPDDNVTGAVAHEKNRPDAVGVKRSVIVPIGATSSLVRLEWMLGDSSAAAVVAETDRAERPPPHGQAARARPCLADRRRALRSPARRQGLWRTREPVEADGHPVKR